MNHTASSSNLKRGLNLLCLITVFSLIFIACKKDKNSVIEISDVRTSGNIKVVSMDFSPGNETIVAITLKSQPGGSGTAHVKLAMDSAAVVAAGARTLPAGSYTIPSLEFDLAAGSTVSVPVTINRSTLAVDTTFAIGFKIAEVTKGEVAQDAKNIVVKLDLRNRWDGRYRVTGTFTDYSAPTITFTEQIVDMVTTSPTQMMMIPRDLGIPGYLILSGASLSYYGSFGPVFGFNPATNKVISVVNSYGQPASNTRSAELDPSGSNQWDATTKNFTVRFWMKQPNTVTTPPYIRVLFINTMLYLGKRYQ
jgi:hypothetical protein